MNNFKLKYSPMFYNDFDMIISYINYELRNSIAASNLIDKVEKAIKQRLKNPLGYEKYKTKKGNIYYRIYVKNYIIFYTISNDVMEVRRIIYNRRNIEKII